MPPDTNPEPAAWSQPVRWRSDERPRNEWLTNYHEDESGHAGNGSTADVWSMLKVIARMFCAVLVGLVAWSVLRWMGVVG